VIVFGESGVCDQVCRNLVMRSSPRCSDARPLVGGQYRLFQFLLCSLEGSAGFQSRHKPLGLHWQLIYRVAWEYIRSFFFFPIFKITVVFYHLAE
jgi:hypothetical protein